MFVETLVRMLMKLVMVMLWEMLLFGRDDCRRSIFLPSFISDQLVLSSTLQHGESFLTSILQRVKLFLSAQHIQCRIQIVDGCIVAGRKPFPATMAAFPARLAPTTGAPFMLLAAKPLWLKPFWLKRNFCVLDHNRFVYTNASRVFILRPEFACGNLQEF